MDNIIERLKRLKGKKAINSSPLEEFFETEEGENHDDTKTESTESELTIKPLGKISHEETQEKDVIETEEEKKNNIPTKGIREFSFEELATPGETNDEEEAKEEKNLIEIKSQDPQKVKHIKLIAALLDAGQYEAAQLEIDKLGRL